MTCERCRATGAVRVGLRHAGSSRWTRLAHPDGWTFADYLGARRLCASALGQVVIDDQEARAELDEIIRRGYVLPGPDHG